MHDPKITLRSAHGYRLIFQGEQIGLDDKLVPIISIGRLDSKKTRAAANNVRRISSYIDSDMLPVFFIGNGIRNLCRLPYPFDEISDYDIQSMYRTFIDWLDHDVEAEYEKLMKQYSFDDLTFNLAGPPKILKMILSSDVSIQCAMLIHSRDGDLDFSDIDMTKSLIHSRMKKTLDIAMSLQKNYRVVDKIMNVRKKLQKI